MKSATPEPATLVCWVPRVPGKLILLPLHLPKDFPGATRSRLVEVPKVLEPRLIERADVGGVTAFFGKGTDRTGTGNNTRGKLL